MTRRILVVEDGTEYVEAFRRLLPGDSDADIELVRAGNAGEARAALAYGPFHAVFFDVVFDRTSPEKLTGDRETVLARYQGDEARAREHLARLQGFYLAADLAAALPAGARIVIAWDFTDEPARLAALRLELPSLEGVEEGAPLSRVLERLLA